ncbi:hypothetical protein D3C87_102830 [compost metagenome]
MNKILIRAVPLSKCVYMQEHNKNSDFRQFLEDELARRSQNSPRYSLRAFARHLEVDSSFLSKILNGKRTVTMRTIRMFGERLNLQNEELQRFAEVSREKKMKRKLDRLLERMPTEEREQSTITLTVDEARLTEAKERIKAFRKELAEILDASATPAQGKTYQISVSLFPVSSGYSTEM